MVAVVVLVALVGCDGGSSSPSAPQIPPDGTVFRVAASDETFHILLQDPERIAEADSLVGEGTPKVVFGRLRWGDGGFNQPWSWHLVPDTVEFGDFCAEIYDGLPSHVEAGLDHWVDSLMYFCPVGELVARVR